MAGMLMESHASCDTLGAYNLSTHKSLVRMQFVGAQQSVYHLSTCG